MKKIISILLLCFQSSLSYSQTSFAIDSLMAMYSISVSDVTDKDFDKFVDLNRLSFIENNADLRLDSLQYDYAFILSVKSFPDGNFKIIEDYFKANDSLPSYLFVNGHRIETDLTNDSAFLANSPSAFENYTLTSLIKEYSKLKRIQTLVYNPTQKVIGNINEIEYFQTRKKELINSYQIQVYVDKKNDCIIYSMQIPPKNPKFKVLRDR